VILTFFPQTSFWIRSTFAAIFIGQRLFRLRKRSLIYLPWRSYGGGCFVRNWMLENKLAFASLLCPCLFPFCKVFLFPAPSFIISHASGSAQSIVREFFLLHKCVIKNCIEQLLRLKISAGKIFNNIYCFHQWKFSTYWLFSFSERKDLLIYES